MIVLEESKKPLKEGVTSYDKVWKDLYEHCNLSKQIDILEMTGAVEQGGQAVWTKLNTSAIKSVFSNGGIQIDFSVDSADHATKSNRLYLNAKGMYLYRNCDPDNCSIYFGKNISVLDYIFDTRKSPKGFFKGGVISFAFADPDAYDIKNGTPAVYIHRLKLQLGLITI